MVPPITNNLKPGATDRTMIQVADPESGQTISIPVLLARGMEDGPVLVLLSAQHGTEINGSAAIHLLFNHLDTTSFGGLLMGIPVANPPAARTRSQAYPSDAAWGYGCPHNMNHVWPGDAEGTLTERMTAAIWSECIEACHAVVDFHAQASQRGPMTTVRATSDASLETAKAFGIPHIFVTRETKMPALYGVAAHEGKAALEVQLPPRRSVDPGSVRKALSGLRNVMAQLQMTERSVRSSETAVIIPEAEMKAWQAPTDGIVLAHVDPGSIVQEGGLVAELISLHTGELAAEAVAPFRGVVTVVGLPAREINGFDTDVVTQGEVFARVARCDA